jgi:predicted O-methyltransferase YrrM
MYTGMYSSFQLAKKYLRYYSAAKNGKGHGIHSPFVFDFVVHVLNDHNNYDCYNKIEQLRLQLLRDDTVIETKDFGAGSAVISSSGKKIKAIAKSSLKNKKFAQLLFRIVNYYQPATIVELGTSFGITTCYLACGNKKSEIYTFEGSSSIADIAGKNFSGAGCQHINLIEGNFDTTFFTSLVNVKKIDLAFVDGNHRKIATLNYFSYLKTKCAPASIIIFDDIHWSSEMEEAWEQIKQEDSVTLTIDLFFIGLVFFNPDFRVKQHFTIRF